MGLEILPPTVYQPLRSGLGPSKKLNTIMEEGSTDGGRRLGLKQPASIGRPVSGPLLVVTAADERHPACRESSPSSSVDSASLTWRSSESGSTVETGTDLEDLYEPGDAKLRKDEDYIPLYFVDQPGDHPDATLPVERSSNPADARTKCTPLIIPDPEYLLSEQGSKEHYPPTPLTSIPRFPIPPALLSLLTRKIQSASGLPSLDASPTSDPLPSSDASPISSLSEFETTPDTWNRGVQLNPDALATLEMLSRNDSDGLSGSFVETPRSQEMEPSTPSFRRRTIEVQTPVSGRFHAGPAPLDIPSPTGFFSTLAPGTRHTWCPSFPVLPSSTTAERFYQCPWDRSPIRTIEQVVEVEGADTDAPSTAQLITLRPLPTQEQPSQATGVNDGTEEDNSGKSSTIPRLLRPSILDRTASWLTEQLDYRDAVEEAACTSEEGEKGENDENPSVANAALQELPADSLQMIEPGFNESKVKKPQPEEDYATADKPGLWNMFLYLLQNAGVTDAFVHCQPRFDAIQTGRICASATHRAQLLGNFHPELDDAMVGCDETGATAALDQRARIELGRKALAQMSAPHWAIMALKYLNGGQLLTSTVTGFILGTSLHDRQSSKPHAKVLDLGGQPTCDWAWHCIYEYPTCQVYTAIPTGPAPLSLPPSRFPQNHSPVSVSHLWQLPFPDHHFEVISARNLYALLKTDKPTGAAKDEYDLCLLECWRCLKPGGYLEFSLLDSELVNAGPLGTAMSVEFSFNLRTRGYDPSPTRTWLGRLKKAGFVDVKRSWTFLPMGAPHRNTIADMVNSLDRSRKTGDGGKKARETMTGSTHAIACISGLVGLRAWESWMLRLQMEAGRSEEGLLEGISAVVQEGRNHDTGWRCLTGWARKPGRAQSTMVNGLRTQYQASGVSLNLHPGEHSLRR